MPSIFSIAKDFFKTLQAKATSEAPVKLCSAGIADAVSGMELNCI